MEGEHKLGLLSRQPGRQLPPNVAEMMERFGRHEIDPTRSTDDGYAVFQATLPALEAQPAAGQRCWTKPRTTVRP